MATPSQVEARIIDLMRSYQHVGVTSVTSDTLSSTLFIPRRDIRSALLRLMKSGKVAYAKKHPRSAQSRYQIKGSGGAGT